MRPLLMDNFYNGNHTSDWKITSSFQETDFLAFDHDAEEYFRNNESTGAGHND